MTTLTYENIDERYNPYTKQIELVDINDQELSLILTQIDINKNDIDLKVSADEILAQINLSSEGVYIKGDRIQLNWAVDVQGSFSINSIANAWPLASANYISTNTLSSYSSSANGVYITSSWITWVYWNEETFKLNTNNWDAFFKGEIGASSITASVNISSWSISTWPSNNKVSLNWGRVYFENEVWNQWAVYSIWPGWDSWLAWIEVAWDLFLDTLQVQWTGPNATLTADSSWDLLVNWQAIGWGWGWVWDATSTLDMNNYPITNSWNIILPSGQYFGVQDGSGLVVEWTASHAIVHSGGKWWARDDLWTFDLNRPTSWGGGWWDWNATSSLDMNNFNITDVQNFTTNSSSTVSLNWKLKIPVWTNLY